MFSRKECSDFTMWVILAVFIMFGPAIFLAEDDDPAYVSRHSTRLEVSTQRELNEAAKRVEDALQKLHQVQERTKETFEQLELLMEKNPE